MALIHSILMGAVAGMRSMTPLAAVTNAARSGNLPADNGAPRLLANKLASAHMNYAQRPLWLVRGQDRAGNDYRIGHGARQGA